MGRRGRAHSIARPSVPISSPLTHNMVHLLPFFELFRWLQKRCRPSPRPTPDTITNTALEAIASSSGTNNSYANDSCSMRYIMHVENQKLCGRNDLLSPAYSSILSCVQLTNCNPYFCFDAEWIYNNRQKHKHIWCLCLDFM